jgi:hypothetical protein
MRVPVNHQNVKKGKPVHLRENLPPHFGNRLLINVQSHSGMERIGYVTSNGFEKGQLNVLFPLYPEGDQHVHFNELSAAKYLEVDITY